ncbi:MAG: glycosyltransferase family 39 protein [Nitrospinae bacterium]|nr:glycosyltransferase family 39 protein [Nitrospinota bacterium]
MYITDKIPSLSKRFKIDIYSPNIILSLLIVTGLILRLYRLDFRSLNFDEANSIAFAKNSITYILDKTPLSIGDLHPPFFHILLHFHISVSETEFWVRLISAVLGVIIIYITYLLGRYLFDLRTAMLGAFLVMLSPFFISYSQEARMYPLFTLLTISSIYFFIKAIDMESKRYYLWFTIFSILNLYTHYIAFFILFAETIFFIINWKRYNNSKLFFLFSLIVIFLSFSPWIPTVLTQFTAGEGQLSKDIAPGTGLIIPYSLFVFSVGETFLQIKSLKDAVSNIPLIFLVAIIFLIPIVNSTFKKKDNRLLFIILIPIIILYILSWKIPRILNSVKYIIALSPVYYLLISYGITNMRRMSHQVVFAILITFLNIASLWNYHYNEIYRSEDWRGVVKYVSAGLTGSDVIIFDAGHMQTLFDYYCKCDIKKIRLNPRLTDDREEAFKNIEKEIAPHKNIWLILSHNWKNGDYYKRLLDVHLTRSLDYKTKGIEIYKYVGA